METSKMETTDIRQVEEMLLAQLADIAEKLVLIRCRKK